jgi:hypothetical protein
MAFWQNRTDDLCLVRPIKKAFQEGIVYDAGGRNGFGIILLGSNGSSHDD